MIKILLTIGLILSWLNTETTAICSCVGQETVESAYKNADMVVAGKVIGLDTEFIPDSVAIKEFLKLGLPADQIDKRLNGQYLRKVSIKINKIYKGQSIHDTLTIYTGMGGGDCGFRFQGGQKYIIYGDRESYFLSFINDRSYPHGPGVYWTDICKRTKKHNQTEKREIEEIKNRLSKE